MREQGVTFPRGCRLKDVSRRLVALGRGEEDLRCQALKGGECPHGADKPRFDEDTGELWARGVLLYTFSDQACNQVAILKKLQKEHWRHSEVRNPLGNSKSKKYGAWLKETVCRLKKSQKIPMIEYHSHPEARTVSWKWRLLQCRSNQTPTK
jgi:hypothetical protein